MNKLSEKKKRKINNGLILCLILLAAATIVVFVVNIVRVSTANTGEGETIEEEKIDNEYINSQYKIGNNSTDINKTYFKELNSALDSGDTVAISQSVVKCFITEYYTWTNKDGNYDIGGTQYVFAPKKSDFAEYTLWNFYQDMDLYITKYGTANLMQVKDVTVNSAADGGNFTVQLPGDTSEVANGASAEGTNEDLPSVTVDATWTYEPNSTIDVSQFQTHAVFHVVNDNGRWEIASISTQ